MNSARSTHWMARSPPGICATSSARPRRWTWPPPLRLRRRRRHCAHGSNCRPAATLLRGVPPCRRRPTTSSSTRIGAVRPGLLRRASRAAAPWLVRCGCVPRLGDRRLVAHTATADRPGRRASQGGADPTAGGPAHTRAGARSAAGQTGHAEDRARRHQGSRGGRRERRRGLGSGRTDGIHSLRRSGRQRSEDSAIPDLDLRRRVATSVIRWTAAYSTCPRMPPRS